MPDHRRHVKCEEEEKQEEVLVVLIAKTIVHESAMVIKPLDTLIAVIAVHSIFRPKILTVNANVIEM